MDDRQYLMTKEELLALINGLPQNDRVWIHNHIAIGNEAFTEAKSRWLALYEQLTGERYYWTGRDSANLKQLLSKIRAKMLETRTACDNTEVVCNFEIFCRKAHDADAWIANNFSVSNVNSQFNNLYKRIKNGKSSNNNRKSVSTDYLASIARDLQS